MAKAKTTVSDVASTVCMLLLALLIALGAIAIGVGAAAFIVWCIMTAWNVFAHGVLHAPALNFWQAWAGVILLGFITSYFRRSEKRDNG